MHSLKQCTLRKKSPLSRISGNFNKTKLFEQITLSDKNKLLYIKPQLLIYLASLFVTTRNFWVLMVQINNLRKMDDIILA